MKRAALLLLLLCGAPAYAAPSDDAAKLSGVDTPQSQALDKDADGLVAQRAALVARIGELNRQRQPVGDLYQQLTALAQAAYKKAEEAADLRARAAVEQRCVKPAEAPLGAADAGKSGGASAFVCPQVLAGGASGGNDLWTVCACARRYVAGAMQELANVRARNRDTVGQHLPDSQVPAGFPLTQEEFDFRFRSAETVEVDTYLRQEIEPVMRRAQRLLARDRIEAAMRGQPPPPRATDELFEPGSLSRLRPLAYNLAQNAIGLLWAVRRAETVLQADLLQQSINLRTAAEARRSSAEYDPLTAGHVADNGPYIAIAQRYDRAAVPFVLDRVQMLRAIAAAARDGRWRLLRDAGAWKDFAAPDGDVGFAMGYGDASFAQFVTRQFMGEWRIAVYFNAWRANVLGSNSSDAYAANREWAYAFGPLDPDDYAASLTRAFRLVAPEGEGTDAGTLQALIRIDDDTPQTMQALASGAGDTQQP